MAKKPKPLTVAEAGSRGGKARAERHSPDQLREWAKKGGWPKGKPRNPATKAESTNSKGNDHDGTL